jgi:hypothetical protein
MRVYPGFPVVGERHGSFLVRVFFSSQRILERAFRVATACFVGLWLGVLTRERLHAIDEEYYTRSRSGLPGEHNYHDLEYNRRGLWEWEEQALTEHFAGCERLILIGAGGGREVLALLRLGFQVDGFESHPGLVAAANDLLREEGYDPSVGLVRRDESPDTTRTYDGIIVGWGAYMLVQSRRRRITLLKELRARTQEHSPILLSFYWRSRTPGDYKISAFMANKIRRITHREPVDVGDWLAPNYVHLFTRDEIASELSEGGFRLVQYSTIEYGHAVGVAA